MEIVRRHHVPSKYSYEFLNLITCYFDMGRIIGRSVYGRVYKGVLGGNGTELAVKILNNISGLDDEEFNKNLESLRGLTHHNVMALYGFCNEKEEVLAQIHGKLVTDMRVHMAVCFGYMPHGSLERFISDEHCGLDWHTRYKIIKGTCEGLKYLHEGIEHPIIVFNLKPSNILLDINMTPRITDFCLSRLYGEEITKKPFNSVRTSGYWPPEYIEHQVISKELDIFSLGFIIVNIMTGNTSHRIADMTTRKYLNLVYGNWRKKLEETTSDGSLEVYCNQVKRCIGIAFDCLKPNRQERPNINDIVYKLSETETMIGAVRMQNEQDDPGQSSVPSSSSITPRPASDKHAEASRSTHTSNYLSAAEPMAMTFQELHRITDGFSEKRLLGKGGFGIVYKGVFDNGEVVVVKKLHNKPGLVEDQFKNELLNLMTVKHQNIIRLVGYCSEAKQVVYEHEGKKDLFYREERALCLEYLPCGNLQDLLSDESCELDWEECYRIIKGISEGLKHLHTGSKDPIYHLDLKPANILLDRNRIPKIGDFGLSRLLSSTETFVTKTYSGTTGYMPPEYMHRRQISSKFDVFSLGVIMIEIIAGPEGYYNYKCLMSPHEFVNHVTKNLSKRGRAKTMLTEELLEVQRFIKIALRCVDDNQAKRPTITEIVEELNTIS